MHVQPKKVTRDAKGRAGQKQRFAPKNRVARRWPAEGKHTEKKHADGAAGAKQYKKTDVFFGVPFCGPGPTQEEAYLNGTDTQVTSQGMLKAKSQLVEVHGEKVTVKAMFELVSMRCPILSVDRLVGKEVVVVMENERRYKSYKKNRDIPPSREKWCVSRP